MNKFRTWSLIVTLCLHRNISMIFFVHVLIKDPANICFQKRKKWSISEKADRNRFSFSSCKKNNSQNDLFISPSTVPVFPKHLTLPIYLCVKNVKLLAKAKVQNILQHEQIESLEGNTLVTYQTVLRLRLKAVTFGQFLVCWSALFQLSSRLWYFNSW